jgi:hypothetical protein
MDEPGPPAAAWIVVALDADLGAERGLASAGVISVRVRTTSTPMNSRSLHPLIESALTNSRP